MNNAGKNATPLVEIKSLVKHFNVKDELGRKAKVHAVDDVSFNIYKGETFGLVGESGCGKTTLGRTLLRLYEPTAGEIFYSGEKITAKNMKDFRRNMQMIFQDPSASLNPRMTVREIIGEPLIIHKLFKENGEREHRIGELLEMVGLNSDHANRYAHEFSGGQQQRIGIARALAVEPEFIVCDEPISALDVSIQSQIVNMLEDMQKEFSLTYLFIAHDLSVVRHISKRIGVMYLGHLVEIGESYALYEEPLHPYTKTLISAVPIPDPKRSRARKLHLLDGEIPSAIKPPTGCRFHTRCPIAETVCKQKAPELREVQPDRFVACHLV